jgi:hypothetical protein
VTPRQLDALILIRAGWSLRGDRLMRDDGACARVRPQTAAALRRNALVESREGDTILTNKGEKAVQAWAVCARQRIFA